MNEQKKGSVVYEYMEKNYKEEWEQKKTWFGSSNRWKQFEDSFNTFYAEGTAGCPIKDIYDPMAAENERLRALYFEIHDTPESERVKLEDDPVAKQKLFEEAQAIQRAQVSDMAALQAFDQIAPYTGVDSDTRESEKKTAYDQAVDENNAQTIEALAKNLEKKAQRGEGIEYLVRGAPLRCLYGSHMRYLDLFETHGVYLDDKALIHSNDCNVDENIPWFGICGCPKTTLTEEITLTQGAATDHKGNYVDVKDGQVLTGIKCKPTIIGQWRNIKEDTQIAHDASAGIKDPSEATCYDAVTNASYLLCKEGGFIMPLTSGQLDYTSYYADFLDYPFEDIGSPAFYKWCDLKGICPYYPGTVDYTKWYQDRITNLSDKGDIKNVFVDYLDRSYQYGLDNMDKDGQADVENMLGQYLGLDSLKEAEAAQARERYSGLRIDNGYNSQKNIAESSPHDPAFYQYYQDQVDSYNEQIQATYEEAMRLTKISPLDCGPKTNEMIALKADKKDLQERFELEMQLYEGDLSVKEKALSQPIIDAFNVEVITQN